MGDDVNDIPLMLAVGLPVAVGDALPSVKRAALSIPGGMVTNLHGGNGAVREAITVILREYTDEKN